MMTLMTLFEKLGRTRDAPLKTQRLGTHRSGMHRLGTNRTLEEACEEERLPREEELLMESVEAESSFSCDSRVATLLIESCNIATLRKLKLQR